jgi:hypothetical protein
VRSYSGKIDHDIDVTEDLAISGQMNGNVTVREGAHLHLSGQTNGDVTVLDGGFVRQSGQLNGVLTCRGLAEVLGQINGDVRVDGGIVLVAEGVQWNQRGQTLVLDADGRWSPTTSGTSVIEPDAPLWRWNEDGSMSRADAPS